MVCLVFVLLFCTSSYPPTDLTTVLECLFWLMSMHGETMEVDEEFVNIAVGAQSSSGARSHIHQTIWSFVNTDYNLLKLAKKDKALEMITMLLHTAKFKPEEVEQNDGRRWMMSTSEYSLGIDSQDLNGSYSYVVAE